MWRLTAGVSVKKSIRRDKWLQGEHFGREPQITALARVVPYLAMSGNKESDMTRKALPLFALLIAVIGI